MADNEQAKPVEEAEFSKHGQQDSGDNTARVEISGDNATLLLAAAEELNLEASVVKVENNQFVVPAEVADKAGVDTIKDESDEEAPAQEESSNSEE